MTYGMQVSWECNLLLSDCSFVRCAGSYSGFQGTLTVTFGNSPQYILVALAIRGPAELPRLILEVSGIPYRGIYHGEIAFTEAKNTLPFEQVPALLCVDKSEVPPCQSATISRFLASKAGLAGSNETDSFRIDMIFELFNSLKSDIDPSVDNVASWREELADPVSNKTESSGVYYC